MSSSSKCKKGEKCGRRNRGVAIYPKKKKKQGSCRLDFIERTSDFSLKYQAIRPLEFVGTRSKAALRIEAYAWVPVL